MEQDIGTSSLSPNFSNDDLTISEVPPVTRVSFEGRSRRVGSSDSHGSLTPPPSRPLSEGYAYAFASRRSVSSLDNYGSNLASISQRRISGIESFGSPPLRPVSENLSSPPPRPISDNFGSPPLRPVSENYSSPSLRPLSFSLDGSRPSTPRLRPRDSSYSSADLAVPHLPWVGGASQRNSMDRATLSDSSLHVIKRKPPPPIERKKIERWTKHKWFLLLSNTLLFTYSLACLVGCLITWGRFFLRADVIIVSETLILTLTTVTAIITLVTAFLGYVGIMLNNRAVLAVYNLALWLCFAMIASIGYVAYRKAKWNLTGKLSFQWHRQFSSSSRSRIQYNMHCCGYRDYTDFSEHSGKCFPRTLLPGCRYKYEVWTTKALWITWVVAFSVLPLHIFVIIVGLMCSNHVNKKFGKGLPPKLYRIQKTTPGAPNPSLMVRTPTPSIFLEQGPLHGLIRPRSPGPNLTVRSPTMVEMDLSMGKLA